MSGYDTSNATLLADASAGESTPSGQLPAPSQTAIQCAQYCAQAGFTGQSLINFVAIAGVESGWNPNAVNQNTNTGDDSWGYFQINYYGSLASSRTAQFGPKQGLLNPLTACQAAYKLSNGGSNVQPWGPDFTSGKVAAKIPEAQAAVAAVGNPGVGGAAGNNTAALGSGASTTSDSTGKESDCLISAPSLDLGITSVGGGCILSAAEGRAILGGIIVGAGGLVVAFGVVLLFGFAGRKRQSTSASSGSAGSGSASNTNGSTASGNRSNVDPNSLSVEDQRQQDLDDEEYERYQASKGLGGLPKREVSGQRIVTMDQVAAGDF